MQWPSLPGGKLATRPYWTLASVCLWASSPGSGGVRLGFLQFRGVWESRLKGRGWEQQWALVLWTWAGKSPGQQMAGAIRVALRPSLSRSPWSCCRAGGRSVATGRVRAHRQAQLQEFRGGHHLAVSRSSWRVCDPLLWGELPASHARRGEKSRLCRGCRFFCRKEGLLAVARVAVMWLQVSAS